MVMDEADDRHPYEVHLVYKSDRREEILQRMIVEWNRSPGLCLRLDDAQARWELARDTCAQLLDVLVEDRVLERRRDGAYGLAPPN
jgi:hypothetical protein